MSLYSTGKKEKSYYPKFFVKEIELIPSYYTLYYYLLYSIIITESVEPHDRHQIKGIITSFVVHNNHATKIS